jgi:CubicO group peptidase (beta-lactamase class C family)
MRTLVAVVTVVVVGCVGGARAQSVGGEARDFDYAPIDALFETYMREHHVPGVVYGIVHDGKLVRVKAFGVQNTATGAPVSADTVFRIASMTKSFTALAALKLRDQGKLQLDAPVERYVPEVAIRYPTADSPRVRVRDLLSHSAGFVTDDPWGDRQLDMNRADFDAYLKSGFPLSRAPQTAWEYSNFGFALAGRVIENVSRTAYSRYVTREFLQPLGMSSSWFDVKDVPEARRAVGYRWQDERWIEEPVLRDGAFGAMGGLHTTASDYARYVAFLLAAWPPRDDPENATLKRSSVREIALGNTTPVLARRPPAERGDPAGCDSAFVYGLGMLVRDDCRLGSWLTHSGGLPGYGSHVVLVPGRSLGVFAFSNRTYAPAFLPARQTARQLVESGAFPIRTIAPSHQLASAADAAARIYAAGDILAANDLLATNFLLDQDAARRNAELSKLKTQLGGCGELEKFTATTATQGEAIWKCEKGRLRAQMLLAPTARPGLQTLEFDAPK